MSEPEQQYGLWSSDTQSSIPLKGMHVNAEVQDLLSKVTISQTYRNDDSNPIEAVYTFPLPLDAVLLRFSVTLGEKQLRGVVLERQQAEDQYEDAITDGDAAILLQQVEPGLFTVNVGNLACNETAMIEFQYALLHHWNEDVLRWYLPTVLAPRYGQSSLQPQQIPDIDITVEHLYTLSVSIKGLLRQAQFECPSHAIDIQELADQTRIQLKQGRSFLDRDLIVLMRLAGDKVSAVCDQDGDNYVALASFCPQFPMPVDKQTGKLQRVIKLLVDCSGSMMGESIAQARVALLNILDSLQPKDRFSFIRFGSTIIKEIATPVEASEFNITRARNMVAAMDADLGGTEIFVALEEILSTNGHKSSADVLLITDGEVWDDMGEASRSREIIKLANKSGQRVFTVGVGSSVSERLVRDLAEQTQGACELVNPGEGMAEKIEHHFKRIYLPQAESINITWPTDPEWQQQPKHLFAGDTLHVFARFKEKPTGSVALTADFGKGVEWKQSTSIQLNAPSESMSTLARLTANISMKEQTNQDEIVRIATKYQLMSEHTAYLVVDVRPEDLKTDGMPELRKTPTMLASGWGGFGSIVCSESCNMSYDMSPMYDIGEYIEDYTNLYNPDDYIAPDAIWKCQDVDQINWIIKANSLTDLQKFGIPENLLDQLKAFKDTSTSKITEHQLILAFLWLLVMALDEDGQKVFIPETYRIIYPAFEKASIDEAVVAQIKDLLFAMNNCKREAGYAE